VSRDARCRAKAATTRSAKAISASLTVAAPAAFATWWLVPRLGRFASLHPDIVVRIAAMDGREPDLWRDGVDVAVVKRPAKLADCDRVEMPLLREIVFPVCAP
jgi:LysR family glycine cleavage system transcriptional activator